jgi:hypothetical protein
MREWRRDERPVLLRRGWHKVCKVIGDHVAELVVGQDSGLGRSGRTRREEVPGRVADLEVAARVQLSEFREDAGEAARGCLI